MKHIYLIFFLITFLASVSYGQKVKMGFKAGMNLANFNGVSGGVDAKIKPGANFGVYGHIPFTNLTYYFPELVFSSQGSKYSYFQSASSTKPWFVSARTRKVNIMNHG